MRKPKAYPPSSSDPWSPNESGPRNPFTNFCAKRRGLLRISYQVRIASVLPTRECKVSWAIREGTRVLDTSRVSFLLCPGSA